MEIRSLSIN